MGNSDFYRPFPHLNLDIGTVYKSLYICWKLSQSWVVYLPSCFFICTLGGLRLILKPFWYNIDGPRICCLWGKPSLWGISLGFPLPTPAKTLDVFFYRLSFWMCMARNLSFDNACCVCINLWNPMHSFRCLCDVSPVGDGLHGSNTTKLFLSHWHCIILLYHA